MFSQNTLECFFFEYNMRTKALCQGKERKGRMKYPYWVLVVYILANRREGKTDLPTLTASCS